VREGLRQGRKSPAGYLPSNFLTTSLYTQALRSVLRKVCEMPMTQATRLFSSPNRCVQPRRPQTCWTEKVGVAQRVRGGGDCARVRNTLDTAHAIHFHRYGAIRCSVVRIIICFKLSRASIKTSLLSSHILLSSIQFTDSFYRYLCRSTIFIHDGEEIYRVHVL
jgi:hypothetical protein